MKFRWDIFWRSFIETLILGTGLLMALHFAGLCR
jgi:hypothetical protein